MTFGEKLQTLRAQAGLSQDALAELLDVSRQAVSKWERNEAMPEAEKIVRISRQFGVSTDYLLLEEQEIPARRSNRRSLGAWFQSRGWLLGVLVALYGLWRLLEFVSGTWEELMHQVDQRTFWEGLETYLFHYKRGVKIAADLGLDHRRRDGGCGRRPYGRAYPLVPRRGGAGRRGRRFGPVGAAVLRSHAVPGAAGAARTGALRRRCALRRGPCPGGSRHPHPGPAP